MEISIEKYIYINKINKQAPRTKINIDIYLHSLYIRLHLCMKEIMQINYFKLIIHQPTLFIQIDNI